MRALSEQVAMLEEDLRRMREAKRRAEDMLVRLHYYTDDEGDWVASEEAADPAPRVAALEQQLVNVGERADRAMSREGLMRSEVERSRHTLAQANKEILALGRDVHRQREEITNWSRRAQKMQRTLEQWGFSDDELLDFWVPSQGGSLERVAELEAQLAAARRVSEGNYALARTRGELLKEAERERDRLQAAGVFTLNDQKQAHANGKREGAEEVRAQVRELVRADTRSVTNWGTTPGMRLARLLRELHCVLVADAPADAPATEAGPAAMPWEDALHLHGAQERAAGHVEGAEEVRARVREALDGLPRIYSWDPTLADHWPLGGLGARASEHSQMRETLLALRALLADAPAPEAPVTEEAPDCPICGNAPCVCPCHPIPKAVGPQVRIPMPGAPPTEAEQIAACRARLGDRFASYVEHAGRIVRPGHYAHEVTVGDWNAEGAYFDKCRTFGGRTKVAAFEAAVAAQDAEGETPEEGEHS